jgi:predicted secreted hydrolase
MTAQTELGAGVAKFLDSIPPEFRRDPELFEVLQRATQGNFGPRESAVVSVALGSAASWDSPLIQAARPLIWPADHGMHMDVEREWYFLVSSLEVRGREDMKIALVTIPMRNTSVSPPIREELGWTPLDAQVVDSNVKMTIVTPGESIDVLRETNVQAGICGGLELDYRPFRTVIGRDSLIGGEDDPFPFLGQLQAHYEGGSEGKPVTIDLKHERIEPYFLQGENGYIPISDEAGYLYYSAAQLKTDGAVVYDGERHEVTGVSWFDHQWGCAAPAPVAQPRSASYGWVWFAFNFEDGSALTLVGPHGLPPITEPTKLPVWGKLVSRETAQTLDIEGRVLLTEYMASPRTGASWPCGWEFALKEVGSVGEPQLTVNVTPWAKDQLGMFASLVEFWEGGVSVVATDLNKPGVILRGVGFCESVGFETPKSYVERARRFLEG